jgi:hypothetical protein
MPEDDLRCLEEYYRRYLKEKGKNDEVEGSRHADKL